MIRSALTLCTGNICRSPLAEVWLRHQLPGLDVSSAGIGALVGHAAEPFADEVAMAHGLDLSAHRARQFTGEEQPDLILAMDKGHLAWLGQRFPHLRGRAFLLGHWQNGGEVPDPFRRPRADFDAAFDLIQRYTGDWNRRLAGMS